MNRITKITLLTIIILATALRIYRLDSAPPSISWDEAAVGVNSWTIANYGKDERGQLFPLVFTSFGEGKNPIHIYLTAIFVKILDLSEFSTRFPAALFGVFNVLLIFHLAKVIFNNNLIGLIASFFLAISPYNLHFSRFNHESNFALFFFMLATFLFYESVRKKHNLLPISIICFCLSIFSYNAAKVFIPIFFLILTLLYFKKIVEFKKPLLISFFVLISFLALIIIEPKLRGLTRFHQTSFNDSIVTKTKIYQYTRNLILGKIEIVLNQYFWHFSPQFLFIQGDKNPRLSSQTGEFYKIDSIFLVVGLFYLIRKKSKEALVLLSWVLLAPLPSSLVAEAPHAGRAMFMMGSWHLISALGLYWIIVYFKSWVFKWGIAFISVIILSISLFNYLNYYFNEYIKRYAIEWQYGMKQIVEYVKDHPEYSHVFTTDARSQPYIFFLFYLKTPLPEYLNTVIYNRSEENKSYNTVSYFGRYYFGLGDPIESVPNPGVLYILTPSQYDGLKYRLAFDVKKLIYYPNGNSAFYLVSVR